LELFCLKYIFVNLVIPAPTRSKVLTVLHLFRIRDGRLNALLLD